MRFLQSLVNELQTTAHSAPNFRLWLTTQTTTGETSSPGFSESGSGGLFDGVGGWSRDQSRECVIPHSILRSSVKLAYGAEYRVKAMLTHLYHNFSEPFVSAHILHSAVQKATKKPAKTTAQTTTVELVKTNEEKDIEEFTRMVTWQKCLYALCFFHAVIMERKHLKGPSGWMYNYDFNGYFPSIFLMFTNIFSLFLTLMFMIHKSYTVRICVIYVTIMILRT